MRRAAIPVALAALFVLVPAAGAGAFRCTEVIGFSQTAQWYKAGPFERLVGDARWQLRAQSGAGVTAWADAGYSGWTVDPWSPCASGSRHPRRVVLTISGVASTEVARWRREIRAAISTIRAKYPKVKRILLQPVVGGPGHRTCLLDGVPVKASAAHPIIDAAIRGLVNGDDLRRGADPLVRKCADYRDRKGHLTEAARKPIARRIAQRWA